MKFYYYFWQWNDGPFKIVWNLCGNAFCFFIFSKWKKYYNLIFDNTFTMYYSSSINDSFSNYGQLNMLFPFSDLLIVFILMRLLSKICKKTIIFWYKFPKFISRCNILQNIRMSNIVILKWWLFEYKTKVEKNASFI